MRVLVVSLKDSHIPPCPSSEQSHLYNFAFQCLPMLPAPLELRTLLNVSKRTWIYGTVVRKSGIWSGGTGSTSWMAATVYDASPWEKRENGVSWDRLSVSDGRHIANQWEQGCIFNLLGQALLVARSR